MRKVKVIRGEELKYETGYEPPLRGKTGVCSKTVENPRVTQAHVIIPPGSSNQRHFHVRADAAMHLLKGRLKMFFGPDHDKEEVIVETGDFVFVPAGVIHGLLNPSNTDEAELVSSYGGVGSLEEAETIFIEPPRS